MVRVVWVVRDVVFWKRRHNPSLSGHEGARVESSPWNQNLVVSFVKEPQNKTGDQAFAVRGVGGQGDQNDDTWNGELGFICSRQATPNRLSCIC